MDAPHPSGRRNVAAPLRVLGIDPGSNCTGYGLLEESDGEPRLVACGVIRAAGDTLAKRLASIYQALEALLQLHQPDVVAVEEVFHAKNVRSALVLGHARGVALLAAGLVGVEVHEYPTRTVKQTVTGHGNADKEQVRALLRVCLGQAPDELDASDAVAVALCHLRHRGAAGRLGA